MYVWLRFGAMLAAAPFKKRLGLHEPSEMGFRVWPQDIDPYMHMNNGRYLTIMDVGRIDLLIRSGLWKACRGRGWQPMMLASTVRFLRPLRLWAPFRQQSRIVAWDQTQFFVDQTFTSGGRLATRCLAAMVVYDPAAGRRVTMDQLMEAMGHQGPLPQPAGETLAWLQWLATAGQGPDQPT